MRARLPAGLLALAALPGCALFAEEAGRPAEVRQASVERALDVTVAGARSFRFAGRTKLFVVARPGKGRHLATAVAALNPEQPLEQGGVELMPEIGFVGGYRGDGTYEIPAGTGTVRPTRGPTLPAPDTSGSAPSNVAVRFLGAAGVGIRYAYLVEPCRLELRANATEGSIDCPKLAAVDGSTVSFRMTWGP